MKQVIFSKKGINKKIARSRSSSDEEVFGMVNLMRINQIFLKILSRDGLRVMVTWKVGKG